MTFEFVTQVIDRASRPCLVKEITDTEKLSERLSVTVCLHKQIEKRVVKYNNFFPFRHAGRNVSPNYTNQQAVFHRNEENDSTW